MREITIRQGVAAILIGLMAGLIEGVLLIGLGGPASMAAPGGATSAEMGWAVHLALSALMGATYVVLFPAPSGYVESVMSGMAYGALWWLLVSLTVIPLATGQPAHWSVDLAGTALPGLVGALFRGAIIGLGCHVAVGDLVRSQDTPEVSLPAGIKRRIVVLGGGFAGVTAARHLEHLFRADQSVEITLISNLNYMLFTPMLTEVTTSSVEPRHITPPLRAFFRRVRVIRHAAQSIDMDRRTVTSIDVGEQLETPFDHLVLALGAVPDYYGLPGLEEHAFTFKTLRAAINLRNHVIDKLEDANDEDDDAERRAKLTFVVAGGGFAGTELVGALNDFIRGSLFYYSNIRQDDVSVILVHSSTRILPELSEGLAAYALSKLELRGVTCKCGFRVSGAEPGKVLLSNGETIDAQTLVWTAGNTPNPLVQRIQGATTERGAIKTDSTFAAVGLEGVWAVGDCAWVPDAKTGLPAPATAQRALVEAPALTRNVHAVINGRKPKAFHFDSLGSLCLLGHRVGVAEVKGMKFSGLLAWAMWRLVYLYRLPTLERRLRVALDWLVDAFFPPDIVQTVDSPWAIQVLHGTSPHHGNLREEA